jgi:hypothetical protein
MGKFEDSLAEGYAAQARESQKADPGFFSAWTPTLKNCQTCSNHRSGITSELCAAPEQPSGFVEPLFYAILKCGPARLWYKEHP